jgi:hypothetical protein
MAKAKGGSTSSNKVSFGKRRSGKYKKAYNKHEKKERNYRGQGR